MQKQKTIALKLLLAALMILPAGMLLAQPTCTITVSDTRVCVGNTVSFSVNYSGTLKPTILWNFGDNTTDTSKTLIHKYTNIGTYSPTVQLNFPDGTSCFTTFNKITVVPLPVPDLELNDNEEQCLTGNRFCFTDHSIPLSGQAPIVKRVIDFGDGFIDNTTPVSVKTLCHTYGQIGVYTITMEISDSNGCVSRLTFDSLAKVYKDMQISYRDSAINDCGKTTVYYFNTSTISLSDVKSFRWDFGDGSFDTTNWLSTTHVYHNPGSYRTRLTVINKFGCVDTISTLAQVFTGTINFNVQHNKKFDCFNGSAFTFTNPLIPNATFMWNFGDPGSGVENVGLGPVVTHKFSTCGTFMVSLYVQLTNGCDSIFAYDTVHVHGPDAVMEKKPIFVTNKYQCLVTDTVRFVNPNPYLSVHCASGKITQLWDFADPFAPSCTTDTRNGININVNCNFSKDSTNVRHWYSPGKERCYYPSLFLKNTDHGCEDKDSAKLVLLQPDADGMSITGTQCLGKLLKYEHPGCGREFFWVNFDSACNKNNWIPMDLLGNSFPVNYSYAKTCDPSGWVTIGLIIKNGDCYDTTWYHHKLYLPEVNGALASFATYGCSPFTVQARLLDTIQYRIKFVAWTWGDGSTTIDSIQPGDSVLGTQSHTYSVEGPYVITVRVVTEEGCDAFDLKPIGVGTFKSFTADSVICPGDTVKFLDFVRYYEGNQPGGLNSTNYWAQNNGVEVLSWDFGDGGGFTATGSEPIHIYTQPGVYTVKMAVKDKTNCIDTLERTSFINVIDVRASFSTDSILICPQFVQFNDSSMTAGPGSGNLSLDSIISWFWDFGDGKTPSYLQNPAHLYTTYGTFTVRLGVTNKKGCTDTITKQISIQGPKPKFRVVSDTISCAPFTAEFENISQDVKNWVWRFGDGVELSTISPGNVTHTYTKPGVYTVYLYGEDTVTNPVTGFKRFCASEFPDTTTIPVKRIKIYVMGNPPVNTLFKNPACVGEDVVFSDASDPKYTDYRWYFNDGDSGIVNKPGTFTRSFDSVGTWSLRYKPLYVPGANDVLCVDSVTKMIEVTDVLAGFDIDSTNLPLVSFTNRSSDNAVKYKWNFGHPASGNANTSDEKDPSHNYLGDTSEISVCLIAFNKEDCADTICKPLQNTYFILLKLYNVFTPGNDGMNDAFDIDIIGEESYDLAIYNRWGEKVYQGNQDGVGNDGRNWNGTNIFTGQPCAKGVYYFVFNYKFRQQKPEVVNGTVTLLGKE
jgi:gliding motility-associated-like protein